MRPTVGSPAAWRAARAAAILRPITLGTVTPGRVVVVDVAATVVVVVVWMVVVDAVRRVAGVLLQDARAHAATREATITARPLRRRGSGGVATRITSRC